MKEFYSLVQQILNNQSEGISQNGNRVQEIKESTAANERKAADLDVQAELFSAVCNKNKAMFLELIEQAEERVSAALGNWKHGSSNELTNVLLLINAAGDTLGLPLEVMTKPFADDPISVKAIKGALKGKGASDITIARVMSDYGNDPISELEAFKNRAYMAFSTSEASSNSLSELIRTTERALTGEAVSLSTTAVTIL